jgi:hypothetical protein
MLFKVDECATVPNSTPILLMLPGAALASDCEMRRDLNDGGIVDSVMLCDGVSSDSLRYLPGRLRRFQFRLEKLQVV